MEFGAGVYSLGHLKKTDLPQDNLADFSQIGLPQWAVPEWKGAFYSMSTPQNRFLKEYAKRLPCVEVSSTFYADVAEKTIHNWCQQVNTSFRFFPKWPQLITHRQRLDTSETSVEQFISRLKAFGKNLGSSILQLPPDFSTSEKSSLFYFLEKIPLGTPLCVEFRHGSWFQNQKVLPKLESYLVQRGFGLVCVDTPSRQDVFHHSYIGNTHIVRYLSDGVEEADKLRLLQWKKRLLNMPASIYPYFFLHLRDNRLTPRLIGNLSSSLQKKIKNQNAPPQKALF